MTSTKRSADEWHSKYTALFHSHTTLEERLRAASSRLASLQGELVEKTGALEGAQERLAKLEKKVVTVQKDTMEKVSGRRVALVSRVFRLLLWLCNP